MVFFKKKSQLRLHVKNDKYYVIHNGVIHECHDLEEVILTFTGKGEITVIKGDKLDMSGYDMS